MKLKKGSSLLDVRKMNRTYIKDSMYYNNYITRQQIANDLGLTLPTITTSINDMIREGIVVECELSSEAMNINVGRPPKFVSLKPNAYYSVGVELGPYETYIVLMDMQGEIIKSSISKVADENYSKMLLDTAKIIQNFVSDVNVEILGVGIGIPAAVDHINGIIKSGFRKDWCNKNIIKDMQNFIGLPIIIDNNVRLRALNYIRENSFLKPESFGYFYISKGIACPIMMKDYVLSGYTSGAGEIGHTTIVKNDEEEIFLDNLAGEIHMVNKCKELFLEKRGSILNDICESENKLNMQHIIVAYEENDIYVSKIIDDSIFYLGIALANLVNMINPEFVIVDAYIMKSEKIRKAFIEATEKRFFGLNKEEVHINFTKFEKFNSAKGAANLVIRKLFIEA